MSVVPYYFHKVLNIYDSDMPGSESVGLIMIMTGGVMVWLRGDVDLSAAGLKMHRLVPFCTIKETTQN